MGDDISHLSGFYPHLSQHIDGLDRWRGFAIVAVESVLLALSDEWAVCRYDALFRSELLVNSAL